MTSPALPTITADIEGNALIVAGRRWPVVDLQVHTTDEVLPDSFPFFFAKRFARIVFESGWGATVIWGSGTYSDNHDAWQAGQLAEEVTMVEVGVWYRDRMVSDGPLGYVTAEGLNDGLEALSELPSRNHPELSSADELPRFVRSKEIS